MTRLSLTLGLLLGRMVWAGGNTLWNSDGPQYEDVIQVKDYDCWFAAASIAVTHVSQNWVENLYYFPGTPPTSMVANPGPASDTAIITIFNYLDSYKPINFTVSVANESTTEDTPGGVWWHSALMQGIYLLAHKDVDSNGNSLVDGVFANATFIPYYGDAYVGMEMLTGFPASMWQKNDSWTEDYLFSQLLPAPATPVTFSTLSNVAVTVPPIEPDHAYGVLNATEYANGTRVIWVRNPWGATDCFQLADVFNNIFGIEHLNNWDSLTWENQGWA